MNKLLLLVVFLSLDASGFYSASAQATDTPAPETSAVPSGAPASLVAHNTAVASNSPVSVAPSVTSPVQQPNLTKVVRIYGGTGFFDLALAEKLRPRLAKGFVSSRSGMVKTVPDAVTVPAKAESKQLKAASSL